MLSQENAKLVNMDPAISSRVRVANAAAPNTMLAFLPSLHMCSPSLGLLHNLKSSLQRMDFSSMLDIFRRILRPFYGLDKWQTHLEQVRLARWGPKPRILTSRCSRSARLLVPYVRNSLKTAFKPIFSCEEEGPFRRNAECRNPTRSFCGVQGAGVQQSCHGSPTSLFFIFSCLVSALCASFSCRSASFFSKSLSAVEGEALENDAEWKRASQFF